MSNDRDGQDPGVYQGVVPSQRPPNVIAKRAPTSNDRRYKIGTLWIDKTNNASYQLTSVVAGSSNWQVLGSDSGAVATLTGDTGGAIAPVSGNVSLLGSSSINATGSTGQIAFSVNENLPQYAEVTLTSAQIKLLATTQIELVAAPGAGNILQFLGAVLKLDYGGTNVFTEAADNLGIKYTDDSGVQVSQTIETTGFIDQASDTYTNAEPVIDAIVASTGAENQALVLDNLNANIAGNAANDSTLIVSVLYRTVSI